MDEVKIYLTSNHLILTTGCPAPKGRFFRVEKKKHYVRVETLQAFIYTVRATLTPGIFALSRFETPCLRRIQPYSIQLKHNSNLLSF